MEKPTKQGQSPEAKTAVVVIILLTLFTQCLSNPHLPQNLTWIIYNAATGDALSTTTGSHPPGTWFPSLTFDLAKLLHLTWDETFISKHHFYVCPGHTKEKAQQCGGTSSYYCSSWSCVSTGHIWWNPPVKKNLISVSRTGTMGQCSKSIKSIEGTCNPVSITFTPEGQAETRWSTGLWLGSKTL